MEENKNAYNMLEKNKIEREKQERLGILLLQKYLINYDELIEYDNNIRNSLYLYNLPYHLITCLYNELDGIKKMHYDKEMNVLTVCMASLEYAFYIKDHCLFLNEKQLTYPVVTIGDCSYNFRFKR